MTKKGTKSKIESKKAAAKARAAKKSPQQMKLAGTERKDAIPELEKQAEVFRVAFEAHAEMLREAEEEQDKLTALLVKHGKTEHVYEGDDGKRHKAFIPAAKAAKAKVQTIKPKKTPKKTANHDGDE